MADSEVTGCQMVQKNWKIKRLQRSESLHLLSWSTSGLNPVSRIIFNTYKYCNNTANLKEVEAIILLFPHCSTSTIFALISFPFAAAVFSLNRSSETATVKILVKLQSGTIRSADRSSPSISTTSLAGISLGWKVNGKSTKIVTGFLQFLNGFGGSLVE